MEQEHELHHVFINHRGPDVKNSLASLIYHRLQNVHGMCVFLDKNEIHTGDNISDAIRTAIQNAYVHITIFSLRYAESSWCLEELCSILSSYHKHNRTVIPVFYDVEPTDLRHIERGCYKIAFEEHQRKGRVSKEVMKNWKEALIKASHLSGLLFKTKESDQGEMLEKIVGIVLKEVRKWGSLDVAKYPVGLKQAADDLPINEILKQNESSDTMIVGIAGMSGAGKSTLAKYLYNMRRLYFNGRSCFLSNVRQEDLLSLQRKLFRDLLGYNLDLQYIGSIAEGRRMLQHCRFLLVLDDVDHIRQIDGLIDIDSVGRGSLILITSPDKGLLTSTSPKTLVYEVKPLNRQQGQELFCQHAFHKSRPSEGFEDLVEKFVEICQGLPLSLEVLGGHFLGENDRKSWERQLSCFSRTLHQDIESVLRVSYDALNSEEKEAFLDIGCFLVGEETELAIRVLNGLYDSDIEHCLETLHQKCFLEFHYDVLSDDEFECRKREKPVMGYNDLSVQYQGYKLTMHDQLRQLALKIGGTLTPFRIVTDDLGLRETRYKMVLNKLEAQYKYNISPPNELLPIRGIRGFRLSEERLLIKRETSYQMRGGGLRLVVMEGDRFNTCKISKGDRVNTWEISKDDCVNTWEISGDLVWLRLRNVRFTTNMFSSISLRLLRVLELQCPGDSIEQFFKRFMDHFTQEPDQSPSPLSELNINALDDALPSTSSSSSTVDPPHLKFSSAVQQGGHGPQPYLFQFLARIGLGMVNLCKMVLTNLTFLQSLPIDFENIGSLRHLDLSGCTSLTELPRSFSKLFQLQYLALRDCRNLSIPVDILGNISTLKYANFKGCAQLVTLPQGIPNQMDLRYLNLLFTSLSQLPDDLEQLGNLEELRIGSPELMGLPLSMAKLGRLSQLNVIQCRHLQCLLPEAIAGPNIKILAIDDCPIASFPFQKDERTIGVLRDLILKKTSISEINMVEDVYLSLETIDLSENIQLKQVVALSSGLVRVNLQNCRELKTLKNISNLEKLKFLNINECLELETLSVEGLISLEEIEADKCCKLKRIEGLSRLERLKSLNINGCLELETLSVEGLISLEKIEADKCCKLKRIEGLSQLKGLKSLNINGCLELETLIVEGLISLKKIKADKCCKLKRIELSQLEGLKNLDINGCLELETLSVEDLISLEKIEVDKCCKLKRIGLSLLKGLKSLNINGCLELETLNVEGLISLEKIKADKWCKLKRIKGLSQLKGLKSLNINGCLDLETLSVEGLISLEEIEANKCWKLKRIEGLSRLKGLKSLKISTDNGIFREDICNFLISPSSDALSTFICTGKVDEMDVGEKQMKMALPQLSFYRNVKKLKIVSTTTSTFGFELEILNLISSQGAILLWFISNAVGRRSFHVKFRGQYSWEYITHGGEGGGRRLHIFMWTQYSELFKVLDLRDRARIYVGCSCDASASEVEEICAEGGWLLMVDNYRNVSEIRKEIFRLFALTDGTGRT